MTNKTVINHITILLMFFFGSCSNAEISNQKDVNVKPNYDSIVSFKINEKIEFNDFTLEYVEKVKSPENGKSTASSFKRVFLIKASSGSEEKISIAHGQTPPKPQEFQVEAESYILYTYQTPDGASLYEDKLYIKKINK